MWPVDEATRAPQNAIMPAGSILDWVLLGPFRSDPLAARLFDGVSRSGYHQDFLTSVGGESQAVLDPETTVRHVTASGQTRIVRAQRIGPAFETPERPDFKHILYNKHILERDYDQAVAYAFCYLVSDREQVVTAYLGSDGSPKVWLNGELVHAYWRDLRQTKPWQDRFRMTMKQGLNRLLIKIDNRRGWWGFQIEVYDAEYHLEGIRRALQGVVIQSIEVSVGGLEVSVRPNPEPLDFELTVEVKVEDREGHLLAQTRGITKAPVHLALPPDHSGPVTVHAAAADPEWEALKPHSLPFYVGDFTGVVERGRKALAKLTGLLAQADAGELRAPAWRGVYDGIAGWLRHALARPLVSTDIWAVRTLDFAIALAGALSRGESFFAGRVDDAIPVGFDVHDEDGTTYTGTYLASLPPDYSEAMEPYPLLINLHGSSGVVKKITFGDPNVPYFDGAAFLRVSPMSPRPLTATEGWDVRFLNAVLADVRARFRIDPERVYLQGGSGGGKGAWLWSLANPEHFAALSVLCGGDGYPFRATRLRHVPVWIFNGELDLASYPFLPELMANALRRAGATVTYTLFPDLAHGISQGIDKDAWRAWYLRQTRSPSPPPEDPLVTLGIATQGVSSIEIVEVPEGAFLSLTDRERPLYPQDNVYRAAMKLYQAYRKPVGAEPARWADGRAFIRECKIPGEPEGSVRMFLDLPDAGALVTPGDVSPIVRGDQGDLEAITLPGMLAARAYVVSQRAHPDGDDWEALAAEKQALYDQLETEGYRRTGEERTTLLTIMDQAGRRYWEVLVGISPPDSEP